MKLLPTHRAAEMIGTPEGDVQTQFFIQKDFADRLDTERSQYAKTQFGKVAISRLGAGFFQLGLQRFAGRNDINRTIFYNFVEHNVIANLNR